MIYIFVQLLTNTTNAAINSWRETPKLITMIYIPLHSNCDFIMTSALIPAECSALQVTCRKLFSKFSLVLKYQYRAYSTNICTPQSNRTATKKPEVRCKNICTPKLNVEQLAKTYINIQVTKIITPNNVLLLYLSFTSTNKHWPNQML